jgi:hypothetical protein
MFNWQKEVDATAVTSETELRLPEELSLDGWSRLGVELVRLSEASAWWIGDWLIYGQRRYDGRYRKAIAETSLDYQTLRNYAWIARRFPPERRRAGLTFQHHMEVAALPIDEQDHWLDFASRLGWSRNELRKQIRASVDGRENARSGDRVRLNLQFSSEQVVLWAQAAERCGCDLVDWVARVLDEAIASTS